MPIVGEARRRGIKPSSRGLATGLHTGQPFPLAAVVDVLQVAADGRLGEPIGDESALVEPDDAIAQRAHGIEAVRDKDDRRAARP
jgi:hypothetical protein